MIFQSPENAVALLINERNCLCQNIIFIISYVTMYTHITGDDFTIFEANIHRNNKRKNF